MTNDDTLGLFEALYTTRAIRRFKPDPVPGDVLRRVLDAAGQAPSGGNRQPWRWLVIRSDEGRAKVSELVARAGERAAEARRTGQDRRPAPPSAAAPGDDFAAHLKSVPVIVISCAQANVSQGPFSVGPFGQTYPGIQNLLLAARGVGLGGTITTSFRWCLDEFRDYLGLPEGIEPTCLIPLGYPAGTGGERHGPKSRVPIDDVTFEERWGQPVTF